MGCSAILLMRVRFKNRGYMTCIDLCIPPEQSFSGYALGEQEVMAGGSVTES